MDARGIRVEYVHLDQFTTAVSRMSSINCFHALPESVTTKIFPSGERASEVIFFRVWKGSVRDRLLSVK